MPNPRKNLKGQTFGRLTVLRVARPDKSGNTQWFCRCYCGETTTVRVGHLTTGAVISCGCAKKRRRPMDTFSDEEFWG